MFHVKQNLAQGIGKQRRNNNTYSANQRRPINPLKPGGNIGDGFERGLGPVFRQLRFKLARSQRICQSRRRSRGRKQAGEFLVSILSELHRQGFQSRTLRFDCAGDLRRNGV